MKLIYSKNLHLILLLISMVILLVCPIYSQDIKSIEKRLTSLEKKIKGLEEVVNRLVKEPSNSMKLLENEINKDEILIGKWKEIGGREEIVEIFNDGSIKVTENGGIIIGKYKIIDGNKLIFERRGLGDQVGSQIIDFTILKDKLTFKFSSSRVLNYQKIE